jgi:hypothetical protein
MGVISSTVLEEGEKVVGIIPNSMFTGGEDVGKEGVRSSFYLVPLRVYSMSFEAAAVRDGEAVSIVSQRTCSDPTYTDYRRFNPRTYGRDGKAS